jgi:hypothetical protein
MPDIEDKKNLKNKTPEKIPETPAKIPEIKKPLTPIIPEPPKTPDSFKRPKEENKEREVLTGTIISHESDNRYLVQVGNRQIRIKTAVSETLLPNTGVVVTKTTTGYYIIGTERYKRRMRKKVVITG